MDASWNCSAPAEADESCPKAALPALIEEYREVKALLDFAQGEVDRVKAAIDQALGAATQLVLGGYEIRRVEGTVTKKWDNRSLNALLYTLRQTENDELADTIEACRFEEPRRGYVVSEASIAILPTGELMIGWQADGSPRLPPEATYALLVFLRQPGGAE